MVVKDDRTDAEKDTHRSLIVGTDSFLSGWGDAKSGASVAAWACLPDDVRTVEAWVRRRSDMKRVREVYEAAGERRYRPRNAAHFHIYTVGVGHPALA